MEERALHVLEFHAFLQTLKAQASSEVGQTLCLNLRPAKEKGEVEALLRQVGEASVVLEEEGDLPVEGLREVRPLLPRARTEGACLLAEEMLPLRSTLGAAGRVKRFVAKAGVRHPLVGRWAGEIPESRDLYKALQSALGPRGEILDSASPELRRIRREAGRARARIRKALEGLWEKEGLAKVFQEQIITLRNERYVVAVKAEFKNALPGIIHDQSQSKATYFVEPLSTVNENNELNLLLKDEKEEERRILLSLTAQVGEKADEIARTVELLGQLDLAFAKAKWARESGGTIPFLNDRGYWRLLKARHPLLESHSAVPIDLHLNDGQSTLIISGANTGGKTVALKTLGLLTLMAQCGIPIPAARGSEVAVFRRIFADIGDEQSLQDHLSTFSAWILTTSRVLKEADSSSLVLLDEVGGGTDPGEGAALTMALIDGLRARGTKTVVTTHLHLLKAYGALYSDVMNVSVEFDPETLRPTFRLIYGRPGESYALLMAEKWGFPHDLIERAQGYLGEGDRRVGELLQALERTQREMEGKRQEAEQIRREAEIAREKSADALERAEKEEERILSNAREETQALVRQAKEELRQLINDFKAKGRTDVHRLGQEIKAREEKITLLDWKPSLKNTLGKRGADAGQTRGLPGRSGTSLGQLREALSPKSAKEKKTMPTARAGLIQYQIPSAAREINVIGQRVDEAIPLVDKAIDEALLGGLKEVEIIHGAGTGRLRKAIREHLKEHGFVRTFQPGGPGRGGDGVTVVEVGPSGPSPLTAGKPGKEGVERS